MTAVDVDALDAARAAATTGWNVLGGAHWGTVINDAGEHVCGTARAPDAALIVAAVNALEPLTSVARAALATRDALRNWGDDLTEAQVRALRRALDKACEVLDR